MCVIKSIVIAFSLYSRIPMPQFAWKDEDMRYVLCFFPWIGIVIGVCVYLWKILCDRLGIGPLCYSAVGAAIPLLLTGGFHVDGFMDTMDAFHSYQLRERKLEILKDPHIGAFSVIALGTYGLFYLGALSELRSGSLVQIFCAGFCLARVLSGIGVVAFPAARSGGMLRLFAEKAQKRAVLTALSLEGALCVGFMLWRCLPGGCIVAAAALCAFVYYYHRCKRELGGITGNTAGYFVLICEVSMLAAAAAVQILG